MMNRSKWGSVIKDDRWIGPSYFKLWKLGLTYMMIGGSVCIIKDVVKQKKTEDAYNEL